MGNLGQGSHHDVCNMKKMYVFGVCTQFKTVEGFMKRLFLVTCALMATLISGTANAEIQKMTLRIATGNPLGSMNATTLGKFHELIEKESGGLITCKAFYGGVAGDEIANVKHVRDGELHVTTVNSASVSPFAPSAGVTTLPYLFEDMDAAKKLLGNPEFLDMIGDRIAKESNVRPLAWTVGGWCILTNSKGPINTIDDLRKLKMRVPPVKTILETYRSWGVEAHPLAWTETFSAIQQGVVDGQDNIVTVMPDQKFWEVMKYITNCNYRMYTGVIVVNDRWFKKLTPETQAVIEKACIGATQYEWEWLIEEDKKAIQQSIDNGMVFNELQDEEVWREAARAAWPKLYADIGGEEFAKKVIAMVEGN